MSGCFRSAQGADTFCLLRGYISTVRKNNINVMDALRQAFIGQPYFPDFVSSG
jgi:transposase